MTFSGSSASLLISLRRILHFVVGASGELRVEDFRLVMANLQRLTYFPGAMILEGELTM